MLAIGGNSASTGYNLTRSLRTRASASAYLSRTPASAGNRQTWTWSAWVKRGTLSTRQVLFSCNAASNDNQRFLIEFGNTSNDLSITAFTQVWRTTTQVFRDPSAWYHIVVNIDTTQATASNRIKVYVNGSQITAFAASNDPSLNASLGINQASAHSLGQSTASSLYLDGYLTEINFIDGQALTPSSFGSTNALTGVWQPARYTGTYGTNGFYLPFTDNSALTTSSNVGLGKDFSGNGNYWTTNNISITAGVTYDSMTDVPTLTSATAANFCVLNPLQASAPTLSSGNLNTPSLSAQTVYGTMSVNSGKWYWEGKCTARATGVTYVGVENSTYGLSNQAWITSVFAMQNNSQKYLAGVVTSYGSGFVAGDTVGVAMDVTNDTLEFFVNGTSYGQITSVGMAQGNMRPMFQGNTATWETNFGQRPFTYTPPTGYVALNTYNLPTPTILKGNTVMDATLYTGNGTSQNITNAGSFKPDLVWTKSRSNAYANSLIDSNRGVSKALFSNTTDAEDNASGSYVTAFNNNGFSVGLGVGSNGNGATYVGWQWQAGQGTTSSNTSGSITSTVSVNASAGFSVVTFTSPSSGTYTAGHGLGVAPSLVISKERNAVGIWSVYHASTGDGRLQLQSTGAVQTGVWTTAPTSSTIWFGSSYADGNQRVAYCFAPIAGYSAFGNYAGNGSTDGPFVFTGFRPKWVMIKCFGAAASWCILDSSRDVYNPETNALLADNPAAEGSGYLIDFLANGFKVRNTGSGTNSAGTGYIYMAFAENPFKNALAR